MIIVPPHGVDGASPDAIAPGKPVIDVHAHAFPMPLLEYLAARGYADLSGLDDETLLLHPAVSGVAQGARIPLRIDQYSVAHRIDSMLAADIDLQLVSAPPFVFGSMSEDPAFVLELTRRSNDALAEYVASDSTRMCALGSVPIGVAGAADEAARCLDELGMVGLTVGTFGGGRELSDPANEDVWALMSQRRTFCFVHPSRASSPDRLRDYYLLQLLGYPAETALAAAILIFGGVLDRHDPVLCLAHGGGCLAGLGPRLDIGWRRKHESRTIARPPTDYLRRFRFDTAVFDATLLSRLISDVGYENILLGTDMPFDLADTDAVATLNSLNLPTDHIAAILGGNARRLMSALGARYPGRAEPAQR